MAIKTIKITYLIKYIAYYIIGVHFTICLQLDVNAKNITVLGNISKFV